MALFGRLFQRNAEKNTEKQAANSEMIEVQRRLEIVYKRNSARFCQKEDGARRSIMLAVVPKSLDVTGLFLLGIIMETIEHFPPLPTQPYVRAFVHLIKFFTDGGEKSFAEAQDRAATVKEQLESLNKLAGYIVSQGREAANDEDGPSYLAACYAAAERYNLLRDNY